MRLPVPWRESSRRQLPFVGSLFRHRFRSGGYALGNFLGATLEEKILSSFVLVEVVGPVTDEMLETVENLREEGYGTTVVTGSGKTGERIILKIICQRNDIGHVAQMIGNRGFVFTSEVKAVWGGYFRQKRK